jgi:hypothetical protein
VRRRWHCYRAALAATGVEIVESPFKRKPRTCKLSAEHAAKLGRSHIRYRTHEEKETDVKIALDMINSAHRNQFDKCILVSGDSDLLPAIKMMLAEFPDKPITLLAPPFQHVLEARELAKKTRKPRFVVRGIDGGYHIARCRLPDRVSAPDGAWISAPAEYR